MSWLHLAEYPLAKKTSLSQLSRNLEENCIFGEWPLSQESLSHSAPGKASFSSVFQAIPYLLLSLSFFWSGRPCANSRVPWPLICPNGPAFSGSVWKTAGTAVISCASISMGRVRFGQVELKPHTC